jgi:hypothetical protein
LAMLQYRQAGLPAGERMPASYKRQAIWRIE